MAEVARKTRDRIDEILDWSLSKWRSLPEVEAEIDAWDPSERISFVYEWPLEEDRLSRLERYAYAMTEEQAARYEELKRVVEKNRPIMERLAVGSD